MTGMPVAVFDQIASKLSLRNQAGGGGKQGASDAAASPFDDVLAQVKELTSASATPGTTDLPLAPVMKLPTAMPADPAPVAAAAPPEPVPANAAPPPPSAPLPASTQPSDAAALLRALKAAPSARSDAAQPHAERPLRTKRDGDKDVLAPLPDAQAIVDQRQAPAAMPVLPAPTQTPPVPQAAQASAQPAPPPTPAPSASPAARSTPKLDAAKALARDYIDLPSQPGVDVQQGDSTLITARSGHQESNTGSNGAPARDFGSEIKVVKDVKVETHMLPSGAPPPALQVANAIVSDLQETRAAPAATPIQQPDAPQPLRVLHLALEPPGLGQVTVHMRMVGDHLDLELRSSGHDAMKMIDADKSLLSESLTSAGYSLDRLVTTMTSDASGTAGGQGGSSQGSTHTGSQDRSASGGERQSQAGQQDAPSQQTRRPSHGQDDRGASRGARDLYL